MFSILMQALLVLGMSYLCWASQYILPVFHVWSGYQWMCIGAWCCAVAGLFINILQYIDDRRERAIVDPARAVYRDDLIEAPSHYDRICEERSWGEDCDDQR